MIPIRWTTVVVGLIFAAACSNTVPAETFENTEEVYTMTPEFTSEPTSQPTSEPTTKPTSESMPESTNTNGNADVVYVKAIQNNDGSWSFHVTVNHPDTGWDDYADGWDVVTPDGTVLKPDPDSPFTRLLLHPHVAEQPFTRSQSNIIIPEGVTEVTVRAHDLVDGFGGQEVVVDLTQPSGENFEVQALP